MISTRKIISFVSFALLLSVLAGGFAMAAEQKSEFGSVDLGKAFDSYKTKIKLETDLAAEVNKIQKWIEVRRMGALLSDDEFNQLLALETKANPTDDDKKKIEEFAAKEKEREQDFNALQQKTTKTDEEKARFTKYSNDMKRVDTILQTEVSKQQEELGEKRVALSQQVMKDVEKEVAAIAQEKKLVMVFNKFAGENALVIYSSVDITDEVIKRLNK